MQVINWQAVEIRRDLTVPELVMLTGLEHPKHMGEDLRHPRSGMGGQFVKIRGSIHPAHKMDKIRENLRPEAMPLVLDHRVRLLADGALSCGRDHCEPELSCSQLEVGLATLEVGWGQSTEVLTMMRAQGLEPASFYEHMSYLGAMGGQIPPGLTVVSYGGHANPTHHGWCTGLLIARDGRLGFTEGGTRYAKRTDPREIAFTVIRHQPA